MAYGESSRVVLARTLLAATATTVDFTGLNGDADVFYNLDFRIVNGTANVTQYLISFNAGALLCAASGVFLAGASTGAVSSGDPATGEIMGLSNNTASHGTSTALIFAKTGVGLRGISVKGAREQFGAAFDVLDYSHTIVDTTTNVTGIRITATVANGMGIGSYFVLSRV